MEVFQGVYILQQFFNKFREPTDYQALQNYLPDFFEMVAAAGSIEVSVIAPESYCAFCRQSICDPSSVQQLGCRKNHVACCWNCLAIYVFQSFWVRKIEFRSIPCPQCQSHISAQICEYILIYTSGGCVTEKDTDFSTFTTLELTSQKAKHSVPPEPPALHPFDCEICYDTGMVEDETTLDCDHRFHKECLKDFFEGLLDERKVAETDVACPKCQMHIDPNILKDVAPKRFQEYLILTTRYAVKDIAEVDEKVSYGLYRFCPKCNSFVIVSNTINSLCCIQCKYNYCVKCGKAVHDGPCDVSGDEG